jgi:predicted kinase
MSRVWSIGHGTRPIEELLAVLNEAGIKVLADVRSAPGSRRHPQFGQRALAAALAEAGIEYAHLRGLGGRRDAAPDSPHVALKVDAFRGYADHMASAEFVADYERLVSLAREKPTAFMCAETLWWRCHRRMLADRLLVDRWDVVHLVAPGKSEPHRLWDVARMVNGLLVYDSGAMTGPLVIVGGAPATGKTTLALALGASLALPVITKDDIKEALAAPFETGDRAWSRQLGVAAYSVLFTVAERVLAGGQGLILESNFRCGISEAPLRALAAVAPAVVIVCRTPDARRRFAERAARGRHRVHIDGAVLDDWAGDDSAHQIDIDTPRLVVDTTNGYVPDLGRIVAFARDGTVQER